MADPPGPDLPPFTALPVRPDAPPGSSWGLWGDDDEVGTLNLIGPEEVRAAAGLVRRGDVFSLNWDLGLPSPPFFLRESAVHTIVEKHDGTSTDDYLDRFYPQASTQWDGLRHMADLEWGFYNGATLAEVMQPGPGRLGIEKWADRGIVGRGVLLDVVRLWEAAGHVPDAFDFHPIGVSDVRQAAAEQGVELRRGDVLMLRTGWIEAYERLDATARLALHDDGPRPGHPGIHGDGFPAFLWDAGIAAIAADNPALEAAHRGRGSDLRLHRALIARLGMPLGEFWDVQRLAAACAADGVWEFLLTSSPLRLGGGAGAPPNVLAIR